MLYSEPFLISSDQKSGAMTLKKCFLISSYEKKEKASLWKLEITTSSSGEDRRKMKGIRKYEVKSTFFSK